MSEGQFVNVPITSSLDKTSLMDALDECIHDRELCRQGVSVTLLMQMA